MGLLVAKFDLIDCQAGKTGSLHPKLISMLDPCAADDNLISAYIEYVFDRSVCFVYTCRRLIDLRV